MSAPGNFRAVDTADTGLLAGLFGTDSALDAFAVDLNIHNEGPWNVDIPLNVLAEAERYFRIRLE